MLYDFLIIWLVGILVCFYAYWTSRHFLFLGLTSVLLVTCGLMVNFEGVAFNNVVDNAGVFEIFTYTVMDNATIFLGYAGFGLGLAFSIITIYVAIKQLRTRTRGG